MTMSEKELDKHHLDEYLTWRSEKYLEEQTSLAKLEQHFSQTNVIFVALSRGTKGTDDTVNTYHIEKSKGMLKRHIKLLVKHGYSVVERVEEKGVLSLRIYM